MNNKVQITRNNNVVLNSFPLILYIGGREVEREREWEGGRERYINNEDERHVCVCVRKREEECEMREISRDAGSETERE